MENKILFIILTIIGGILFTCFILNNDNVYAKNNYPVYVFQAGAYRNKDNAESFSKSLPSSIIIKEKNIYKIYIAIYKDIDIVSNMAQYFENNNIRIYLKSINTNKKFYLKLNNYERILKRKNNNKIYNQINQNILNIYKESLNND